MEMNVGELWTVKKMAEYFSLSEGAYLNWERKLGARGPRALRLVVKGLGPVSGSRHNSRQGQARCRRHFSPSVSFLNKRILTFRRRGIKVTSIDNFIRMFYNFQREKYVSVDSSVDANGCCRKPETA